MDYEFWIVESSDVTLEGTVVVAPACRQAGSLLCEGKVVSEFTLKWHPDAPRHHVGASGGGALVSNII